MKFLNKIISKEYEWMRGKLKEYWKKPIFIIWMLFAFYILYKLWYLYVFLILYISVSIWLLLIKNEPKIIVTQKKLNIFLNYFRINLLKTISKNKFNIKILPVILVFYLFRIIFGVSYKFIRASISLFDCFFREYEWAEIKRKKKNNKIIKKYFQKSIERWSYIEFIKETPVLEKEIEFEWGKFKKKIKIIIK